jgi:hypothetical protein
MSRFASPADALAELGCPWPPDRRQALMAWRRMARQWHPDRNPAPEAAERFRRARAAYEALKDWIDGKTEWPSGPAAAAPRSDASNAASAWRAAPGARMRFTLLERGSAREVFYAFFRSWASNAVWAAQQPASLFDPEPARQLADGLVDFFRAYYPGGASVQDSAEVRRWSLEALWQARHPGVAALAAQASALLAAQAPAGGHLAQAFAPATLFFRPQNSALCFFLPNALLDAPWLTPDPQADEALFRSVADLFSFTGGSVEALEREHAPSLEADARAREGESYVPFACKLIRRRPRHFRHFAAAGWFNLNDPLYAALGFDPWTELLLSEGARAGCQPWLLSSKGAQWIVHASEKAGNRRAVIVKEFERELIQSGAYRGLPYAEHTPLMEAWAQARSAWRSLVKKKQAAKPLGARLAEKLPFRAPKASEDPARDLFEAARAQNAEAFAQACARCQARGASALSLREDEVPLVQFLLWQAGLHPAAADFVREALARLEAAFGPIVWADADSTGHVGADWRFLLPEPEAA